MLNLDKLLQRMAGSCLPGKKSLMKKDALLEKISRLDKLPMLPDVAMRIIDLSNDPDLYASKVASTGRSAHRSWCGAWAGDLGLGLPCFFLGLPAVVRGLALFCWFCFSVFACGF